MMGKNISQLKERQEKKIGKADEHQMPTRGR